MAFKGRPDEHILNLVKRSLSNPQLQVFVCCYDTTSLAGLQKLFRFYKNVQCIALAEGKPLDFTAFWAPVAERARQISSALGAGAWDQLNQFGQGAASLAAQTSASRHGDFAFRVELARYTSIRTIL